eukprot:COSAG05_NODE_48_length_24425_cov_90.438543_20_plen_71_part_00
MCTVTNLPAGSCVPIKGKKRGCQAAGIAWSTYLEKFVVTLGCGSANKLAIPAYRAYHVTFLSDYKNRTVI